MTRTLHVRGQVPSFKNRKQIRRRADGTYFLGTDSKMKRQLDSMILQLQAQWPDEPIEHPEIAVTFRVRAQRADRDNMLNAVMDALVAAGVLVNDNIKRSNGRLTLEPAVVSKDEEEGAEIVLTWEERRAA